MRPATIDEAETFGIAPGAELFELERLRMLDGAADLARPQPRAAAPRCPTRADIDFTTASLYDALDARRAPARARGLRARGPRRRRATRRSCWGWRQGAPVLFATTVAIGADGRIVDLGRTVYRADRYRFQATLMRRAHTGKREASHEETFALRGACRSCWRSPSPRAAGRPGEEKPNEQSEGTPAEAVKTDGFEKLGPSR